jgi:hypothetical protein
MKRLFLLAPLSLACVALAGPAAAEGSSFGGRAHTVLVLDNLAGAMNSTYGTKDDPTERGISSFGTAAGIYAYSVVTRFGVHQFVTDSISLGGGFHYSDRGASLDSLGIGSTIFALSPRVGVSVPISDTSAFWFRAGVTYLHSSYKNSAGSSYDLMLGGEIYYVYTPVEHFGITLGPVIEWGVAGSLTRKSTTTGAESSVDTRRRMFGVAFGFLFDF